MGLDDGALVVRDGDGQAELNAPQPPELRYGHHTPRDGTQREQQQQQSMPGFGTASPTKGLGVDLLGSPSLPMLSPGRPGARNWVTFLHG